MCVSGTSVIVGMGGGADVGEGAVATLGTTTSTRIGVGGGTVSGTGVRVGASSLVGETTIVGVEPDGPLSSTVSSVDPHATSTAKIAAKSSESALVMWTLVDSFEDSGDALATAYAHRHQAGLLIAGGQLFHQLYRHDGAGRADRMAKADSAAVHVGGVKIEA